MTRRNHSILQGLAQIEVGRGSRRKSAKRSANAGLADKSTLLRSTPAPRASLVHGGQGSVEAVGRRFFFPRRVYDAARLEEGIGDHGHDADRPGEATGRH
jgi:hypothetical protein